MTYFYLLWNCVLNGVPVRVAMPSHPRPRTAGGIDALNVAVSRDGESTVTLSFDATHTQDTVLDSMVSRDVQVLGCGRSKGGGGVPAVSEERRRACDRPASLPAPHPRTNDRAAQGRLRGMLGNWVAKVAPL